ncbi:MAG: SWIB/MDM2 domain-containing protein [Candidatus Calescibacterium sp.]|nr:SWIB/MDM2 domain-containing protein [Candidatus Calescibacterium sp.]MDW8087599.1 SWIB/MDM2 domain-containing protein [Candidatus Calescibacterium sp.]
MAKSKTTKKEKSEKKKRQAPASFFKEFELSPELSDIVGKTKATMQEAIKGIWTYIKQKGLQVKREIKADEKLKKIFGKDVISMFDIPKIVKQNMAKK